ncbi:MAG: 4Fe-4S dicluster domain-containing protein [Eggerthellaceae bacterium]|nr:4Fe-4S dicluster domain-containing protein [Eggerthellaceae bacterium]
MIDRRELLMGIGGIVGMFAVGGIAYAVDPPERDALLRPPGGQYEKFAGLCIKCDRCRTVCPLGCVSFSGLEDGLISARTPVMDFHKGYCDFCNKCIEACPTGALRAFDPAMEKIGIAVIDTEACIAYERAGCTQCFDICEYDAIVVEQGSFPKIINDRCNGCGECVYVCPSNVYGAFRGSFNRAVEVVAIQEVSNREDR